MESVRFSILAAATLALGASGAACTGSLPSTPRQTQANDIAGGAAQTAPRSCKRSTAPGGVTLRPLAREGAAVVLAEHDDQTLAIVADSDERGIHVVDVDSGRTLATTALDGVPSQVAMLDDGRVVAALRDRSKLVVFEPDTDLHKPLVELCRAPTPTEPVALTLAPDGKALYAVAGWGAALAGYDTSELRPTMTVEVAREPREVVVSADAKRAFIAHAVGGKASVVELDTKTVDTVATTERFEHDITESRKLIKKALAKTQGPVSADDAEKVKQIYAAQEKRIAEESFSSRRTACQSFALAKSTNVSGRVFLPQVLVDPGDASQRTAGYGDENITTEVPSVAVLDPSSGLMMPTSLQVDHNFAFIDRSQPTEHCILPRSAAVHDKSNTLLVGCFGTDVVVAYDALSPDPVRAEKRRWRVASGPSGIAIDTFDERAVVWSQFDRTLNVISLANTQISTDDTDEGEVRKIEIPSDAKRQVSIELLLGRSLFHSTNDTRVAIDGRACASCHPDGREDGLTWATPNGPRRTKLLAGGLEGTAPFAWDGGAPELEDHVRETFKRLRGAGGLRSIELRALVSFMRALPPPPKAKSRATALAERGAEIFASEKAGCASCHTGDTFTDNKTHDVKSRTSVDRALLFNTPSLRYLRGRAPYYHDGRYATLRDLLKGVDGAMGHTKHLSSDDLGALEAFLMTL